jgi:hypothetical protein
MCSSSEQLIRQEHQQRQRALRFKPNVAGIIKLIMNYDMRRRDELGSAITE